jgi:hypothetical protein
LHSHVVDGWWLVAAGLVTIAVGVNARTALLLLFPSILRDFGGNSAVSGMFSLGLPVSAFLIRTRPSGARRSIARR